MTWIRQREPWLASFLMYLMCIALCLVGIYHIAKRPSPVLREPASAPVGEAKP